MEIEPVWYVFVGAVVALLVMKLRDGTPHPPAASDKTKPTPLEIIDTEPTAEEIAAEERHCSACKFFELDGAQQAMARNPAFSRYMHTISPYEAGRKSKTIDKGICPDCNAADNEPCNTCSGHRRIVEYVNVYPSHLSPTAKWSEHGWCTNPDVQRDRPYNEEIVWGGAANCEGKLFQLRPKRNKPALQLVS